MTTKQPLPGAALAPARIRAAVATDWPAIEQLLVASALPLDGVRDALSTFVVAESGGALVGVAGLERCRENALLRSVAVAHAWRSHGVGRAMVERVIADAESRDVGSLYLLTTTAERWFPSFGFEAIERSTAPDDIRETSEFQGACPASATMMRRDCARS